MRTCTKCFKTKDDGDFYNVSSKCKECTKAAVSANYYAKREQYGEYERKRCKNPERKQRALDYQRKRRAESPEKNNARQAITWAVRRGWLKPQPCEVCGVTENIEAHHHDYSKPLDVRWLCFKHHREVGHGQIVTAA